jgi:hypothetical protein
MSKIQHSVENGFTDTLNVERRQRDQQSRLGPPTGTWCPVNNIQFISSQYYSVETILVLSIQLDSYPRSDEKQTEVSTERLSYIKTDDLCWHFDLFHSVIYPCLTKFKPQILRSLFKTKTVRNDLILLVQLILVM